RRFNFGKQHFGLVDRAGTGEAEQKIRSRVLTGNGDAKTAASQVVHRKAARRKQQRTAAAAERAAGVEQYVALDAVRVGVVAQLRDLRLSRQRCVVQLLDIREVHDKLEPFGVDAVVDDRVEHEAIVRTGREAE